MSFTRSAEDRQYEHIANVRHGVSTGPFRIEFDADVKDETASKSIRQGSVVSLDSTGKYILGGGTATSTSCPVPCISLKNAFDPDVTTGYAGKSMKDRTYSAVGGVINAIPVTCGYELETTEFDTTSTYAPGDYLAVGTGTNIGKLVKATKAPGSTEVIVGVVSKAPATDYFSNSRIAFFTAFIPAGMTSAKVDGTGVSGLAVSGTGTTFAWSFDATTKVVTATLS